MSRDRVLKWIALAAVAAAAAWAIWFAAWWLFLENAEL
jgi:hypothetical protein